MEHLGFDVRQNLQWCVCNFHCELLLLLISAVDGLRLDSAGNVETDFFPGFAAAATVFCTGEIYSGVPAYVCPYQEVMDSTLNYPV